MYKNKSNVRKKTVFVFAALLAVQAFAVSVDFYDEQQNNPSATGIRLRINNDSNYPISNAKLRYYFHKSSQPYAVDGYYLANAAMTVNDINDDLAYFEIAVPSVPAGYYPDMAGFSLALHNADWSGRDKTLDYSYQVSASLAENSKVVLLSGDDILFGVSPDVQSMSAPGILKISGLKFSTDAWLELKNVGTSALNLSEYQIVDANNSVFSINGSLEAGEIFRICQNQTACGKINKSQILANFSWGNYGEVLLKHNSTMVSYTAWGQPGAHADDAVDNGVWSDAQAFFPAARQVQYFDTNYTENTFFRLKPHKSGASTDDWFSFTNNDNPSKVVSVPLPIKTSANKPIINQIPGDNDVLFSWLPVHGVNSYKIRVQDQNKNDVYNISTPNTSVSLALAPGFYSWTVIGEDEFPTGRVADEDANTENVRIVVFQNIDTKIFKQLKIHLIKARRDTEMLNLGYLRKTNEYSWDRPNIDAIGIEPHEQHRCWAVATQVMNHFYGGNLTQDEIVYKIRYKNEDPLLSPFYISGAKFKLDSITGEPSGASVDALKWALNTKNLNYASGPPSYETVKKAIDEGKLIYAGTKKHAMIIYGYVGDSTNYAFYYAFIDNNGHVGTSLSYTKEIEVYFIPEVTKGDVAMSDPRIHMDSDGDGITNYEEIERFKTDPFNADSDNDGIEDKREIYNYTKNAGDGNSIEGRIVDGIYSKYLCDDDGGCIQNPICSDLYNIRFTADKNKNNVNAERDRDDDGDGIDDGLFDKNSKNRQTVKNMDIVNDYTIFAREYIKINDNVKCYNTQTESNSFCNVISADEDIFTYGESYSPITIGARAHVGNIDFYNRGLNPFKYPNLRDKVFLRNSAVIHGDINAYVANDASISLSELSKFSKEEIASIKEQYLKSQNISDFINMQENVEVQGEINIQYKSSWNNDYSYTYSTTPKSTQSKTKIVKNGEIHHLKNNDEYKILRVQSGGTLIIDAGEMFVDSILQIDANATIRFANPGE